MPRPTGGATWEMREGSRRAAYPLMACRIRSQSHSHLCRSCSSNGSDYVAREARDMRERRDMARVDFHLVSPVALAHQSRLSRASRGQDPAEKGATRSGKDRNRDG